MDIQETNDSDPIPDDQRHDPLHEPAAARAMQSLILITGLILFFSVLFGSRFGPAFVGLLILATTLAPARELIDHWLVGTSTGPEAQQAATLRIAGGIGIMIAGIIGLFPF